MFAKKKKSSKAEEQLQQDKHLIAAIQPQGGITFSDEKLIKTGDGYEIVLHIYRYPKYIDKFWLTQIVNIDNVVVTIDIETKDQQKVKQNINNSMSEQRTRIMYAKDMQEKIEAEDEFSDLEQLYNEVSRMNQVMKLIHVRLFVSGRTIEEVENNAKEIMNHLESNGYKSAVFLNETQHEWQSMFYPIGISNAEAAKLYARNGQPCTSSALAGGDPFHFTSLNDEYGSLYGTSTATGGGKIILDLFHKDNQRTSYNGIIIGKMGSGKSTLLKKMLMDRAVRGDYIRGYDPSGEFRYLVEELGGNIVSLDGTDGILNMMQIMMSAEIDSVSYVQHISKLNTIYKFLVPDATQPELLWYEKMVRKLYIKFGIIPEDEQIGGLVLTNLNANEYPILADLMEVIREEKALHTSEDEAYTYISKIELVIENLITNYGYIFNGHTSIEDILSDQIVFFDIKNLAGMKSEIFDAQLFSSLSLCWDNCIKIGRPMKELFDNHKIAWEDIRRFMVLIDESHKTINANKPHAVDQVSVFAREARKFFGGIYLASQSIRDFVPEGSSNTAIDKIKVLFDLSQYKFVLNQDTNAIETIDRVFGHSFTQTELSDIPKLSKGQTILSIQSSRNIAFNIDCTEQELELFRGGA